MGKVTHKMFKCRANYFVKLQATRIEADRARSRELRSLSYGTVKHYDILETIDFFIWFIEQKKLFLTIQSMSMMK